MDGHIAEADGAVDLEGAGEDVGGAEVGVIAAEDDCAEAVFGDTDIAGDGSGEGGNGGGRGIDGDLRKAAAAVDGARTGECGDGDIGGGVDQKARRRIDVKEAGGIHVDGVVEAEGAVVVDGDIAGTGDVHAAGGVAGVEFGIGENVSWLLRDVDEAVVDEGGIDEIDTVEDEDAAVVGGDGAGVGEKAGVGQGIDLSLAGGDQTGIGEVFDGEVGIIAGGGVADDELVAEIDGKSMDSTSADEGDDGVNGGEAVVDEGVTEGVGEAVAPVGGSLPETGAAEPGGGKGHGGVEREGSAGVESDDEGRKVEQRFLHGLLPGRMNAWRERN